MIEFGSDFHYIEPSSCQKNTVYDLFPNANYYADGRQALIHLYQTQGWERLWVPEFFCYDVIETLKDAGMALLYYADFPGYEDDSLTLKRIQQRGLFHSKDAILRVNYFGLRSVRSSDNYSVAAIVEDHSHDLLGTWAQYSEADWCIASLRKTLPIPEGGILWSPKKHQLPEPPTFDSNNEVIATERWKAMHLKAQYLAGNDIDKSSFRSIFVTTESFFESAPICLLDRQSQDYLRGFDIKNWYLQKKENWNILREIKKPGVHVLESESIGGYPFSLVLLFNFHADRDRVRAALIENMVYPAILWNVPAPTEGAIYQMSRGILSIHCDSRYKYDDILQMKSIIESVL